MDEHDWLAERFKEHRTHMRSVAYRILGSPSEADDAVQEAWVRLSCSGASGVENLGGWLTTVVSRVCLDMLRSRRSRREEPVDPALVADSAVSDHGADPEQEAVLGDSVGLALLVALETLGPAERVAFVLHDLFGVPFEEIASIVDRSPAAARQLASRARRRVQGAPAVSDTDQARRREVVEAFLAASRGGDFDALMALLDPDDVLRPGPGRASRHGGRRAGPRVGAGRRDPDGLRLHLLRRNDRSYRHDRRPRTPPAAGRGAARLARACHRAPGLREGGDLVQAPVARHPFELVLAAIRELDPRPHHQVLDRAGHQHAAVPGQRHDPGGDVHGQAGDLAAVDLDLAGVQARPDLDPE